MIFLQEIAMRARGIHVEAGINDAPLIRNRSGVAQTVRDPLNLWLMPEANQLTVLVSSCEVGNEVAPLLDVAIAFPEDLRPPLCRVGWGMPTGGKFEPFRIAIPFCPPVVPKTYVWEDAAPLPDLEEEHIKDAQAAAMALYATFAGKDVDGVIELLDYRLHEMSAAFEIELSEHRAAVRRDIAQMVQAPGFALEPASPGDLRVSPCCEGRIFHLHLSSGSELVTTLETDDSYPQSMQVYVALIRGEWKVVR